MALSDWTYVTITGTFNDYQGNPCTGSVIFESKQVVVVDNTIVVPKQIVATLDSFGSFIVSIPSTNDPDLNVTGWSYKVYENIDPIGRVPYNIFVPYTSTGLNLATIAPVVPAPQLVSTRGPKGDKGDTGATGAIGPQGPQGPQGIQGPIGPKGDPTATVNVGDTTTLPAGSAASVSNSGTNTNVVLNFSIPKGDQGDTGPQGVKGDTGSQGPVGPQGVAGPAGPAGLNWAGAYDGTKSYNVDDAVSYLNASWFATASHAANDGIPPTNIEGGSANTGWALLAQEGAQGPQGPQGAQGVKGDDGHILTLTSLGNITGTASVDLSTGNVFTATLTGNTTLTFTGLPASGKIIEAELRLLQDATGSRVITWPANGKWPGGTAFVLSTAANALDYVGISIDSSGNWTGYPVEAIA